MFWTGESINGLLDAMLSCGHDRAPFGSPICQHLRGRREPDLPYVRWYLGVGLDYHLLCGACEPQEAGGTAPGVALVCEECFEYATEEAGDCVGVKGAPEVRSRPEPFDIEVQETEIPRELGPIVDLAAVSGEPFVWLLLSEDGTISRFDLGTGSAQRLTASTLDPEADHEPWNGHHLRPRLHASSDGRFAGVVHDYGTRGQVIDLSSGAVTARLGGGEYHSNTVPFSFAFVDRGGQVAALHRSKWNRLDLTDAATGECLTARKRLSEESDGACGEEDEGGASELDYFFGGLHLNPGQTCVAVDGWVWHPVGAVVTWTISHWTDAAAQRSAAHTSRCVCDRAYYWDGPMTWLDDETLIVGGIGDDDERMVEGARVFRLSEPRATEAPPELATFAGPSGTFLSDGKCLFSADATGLSRWDPTSGFRTGHLEGFSPTRRHGGSGEMVQLTSAHLLRWGRLGPTS